MSGKKRAKSTPTRSKKRTKASQVSIFTAPPELQKARKLWAANKLIESAKLFEGIVKQHPANIPALVDASRVFGSLYQYEMADEFLERAIEVGSGSAKAMFLAGQSYRLIRRHDRAIECFKAALQINDHLPDADLELAILYERRHEMDLAIQHCDRRLAQLPTDGEAEFLKGRVLRRQGDVDRAQELLEACAKDSTVHWMTRGRIYAELAKLYEDQQRFDLAWTTMQQGKQITSKYAELFRRHRDRLVPPMQQLAAQFHKEDFANWAEAIKTTSNLSPEPVFLTGMPRSGTTLLGRIVDAHPDIATADEFDLFPRLLFPMMLGERAPEEMTAAVLNQMPTDLMRQMRTKHNRMMTSALPHTLQTRYLVNKFPSLLPLLAPYLRIFPREKTIVMLREPRDILISCMMSYMPLNDFSVDFLELESAVGRIESDLASWLSIRDKLSSDLWVEVKYEDVVADFKAQVSRVLALLDLDPADSVDNYLSSKSTSPVYSQSYSEVAVPIHKDATNRWRPYQEYLEPVLERLEQLGSKIGY